MAIAAFERFDETVEIQMRHVFETLSEKDKRRFAAIQARQWSSPEIVDTGIRA